MKKYNRFNVQFGSVFLNLVMFRIMMFLYRPGIFLQYWKTDAAAWLVFVGLAAVSYHGIMISFRVLYCAAKIGHSFARFSFTVINCLSATDLRYVAIYVASWLCG